MKITGKEEEIEKVLQSLDGLEKASAPPYFYSKLQARLSTKSTLPAFGFVRTFTQPAFSAAALLIFIFLNGFAINQVWQQKKEAAQVAALQSFAKDYDLDISTVYEK